MGALTEAWINQPAEPSAAPPGGFQIYLMARSDREEHPTGGIGHKFLMWAVDTPEALEHFAQALRDRGHYVDTHTSGGVQFVEGHDPDRIRVVIAHPSPQQRPRSVLDSRFYNRREIELGRVGRLAAQGAHLRSILPSPSGLRLEAHVGYPSGR